MKILIYCLLFLSVASQAWSTPCLTSNRVIGADYFSVEIDGSFYRVDSVNEIFNADTSSLIDGYHVLSVVAVNEFGSGAPTHFFIFIETIKNKRYYTIYPEEGYEELFGEKLFIIINVKANKEVGGN